MQVDCQKTWAHCNLHMLLRIIPKDYRKLPGNYLEDKYPLGFFDWIAIYKPAFNQSLSVLFDSEIKQSIKVDSPYDTKWKYLLPIFLDNLELLEYEFPFLVLLWFLVCSLILPTQQLSTIRAVDISNCVETSDQLPIFFTSYNNVHCMGEEKGSSIACLNKFLHKYC